MAQIKSQSFDKDGNLIAEEYYAEGEYEQVIEAERIAQIVARNANIDRLREERYKNEIDVYAVRLFKGEVTQEFIDGLYAAIKKDLPKEPVPKAE